MKQRITYIVPFCPSGTNVERQVTVTEERIDRDWTYFKCEEGSKLGIPTHWIAKREDVGS